MEVGGGGEKTPASPNLIGRDKFYYLIICIVFLGWFSFSVPRRTGPQVSNLRLGPGKPQLGVYRSINGRGIESKRHFVLISMMDGVSVRQCHESFHDPCLLRDPNNQQL